MFCFPNRGLEELHLLSFHNSCVHWQVNKTKFERKSSLVYYHITCFGKTKHTSQRGLLLWQEMFSRRGCLHGDGEREILVPRRSYKGEQLLVGFTC